MPKLRRDKVSGGRRIKNADSIPLHLRWVPGLAGTRRNPGREDVLGLYWNSGRFLSPPDFHGNLEDDTSEIEIEVLYQIIKDLETEEVTNERQPVSVSLSDIARPAKAKGIRKDFVVVETPRRVVPLNDEFGGEWPESDEEWESIYAEETQRLVRRTYSEVLCGNDKR